MMITVFSSFQFALSEREELKVRIPQSETKNIAEGCVSTVDSFPQTVRSALKSLECGRGYFYILAGTPSSAGRRSLSCSADIKEGGRHRVHPGLRPSLGKPWLRSDAAKLEARHASSGCASLFRYARCRCPLPPRARRMASHSGAPFVPGAPAVAARCRRPRGRWRPPGYAAYPRSALRRRSVIPLAGRLLRTPMVRIYMYSDIREESVRPAVTAHRQSGLGAAVFDLHNIFLALRFISTNQFNSSYDYSLLACEPSENSSLPCMNIHNLRSVTSAPPSREGIVYLMEEDQEQILYRILQLLVGEPNLNLEAHPPKMTLVQVLVRRVSPSCNGDGARSRANGRCRVRALNFGKVTNATL
ncbi:hypothetical protein EVAR_31887_1 [Eumeta japonica]|uniref:Uncharacterized protein n=1 Tax=Eumeta variegata TaxID=151549 RepID=A0A4C1WZ30_EUMVA|nr:hypothetical protein EVAR_31887_1 [Eumeta japonica]